MHPALKIALIALLTAPPIGALAIMLPIGLVISISGAGLEAISITLLSIPLSYLFGGPQAFVSGFLFYFLAGKIQRWQTYVALALSSAALSTACVGLAGSNAYFLAFPSAISSLITTRILFTNKIKQLMHNT